MRTGTLITTMGHAIAAVGIWCAKALKKFLPKDFFVTDANFETHKRSGMTSADPQEH